ncbi:hypothetical protein PV328_007815 [Microctonus aethiopoides]|uniref:Uncharacterized protein n=1 Tax=Microctonus aethiopoides TaxID=144406 RepID=A0AA39C9H6_9HYME|nr:hypothetical protein PV328_007815 [Microctonus aethiopoides]
MTDDPSTVTKSSANIHNSTGNIDLTTAGPSTSVGKSITADPSTVINPPITVSTHVGSMNSNRRKRAAEYQRDYRARGKEE